MIELVIFLLLQTPPNAAAPERKDAHISIPALEDRIHELVNAEREKAKLRPLKLQTGLSDVARAHSRDMAARSFFDHINPDGKNPTDRGRAGGQTCRKDFGTYYTYGLAENIFQNNLYNRVRIRNGVSTYEWNSMEGIAVSTVKGWMDSPGHRANILRSLYDRTGIGIAIAGNDQVLITQLFC